MTSMSSDGRTLGRTTIQTAALAVGAVFLLVGVLGFIPGITTNYETLGFAGHESEALLLGIFQVSILHNIVMARSAAQSRNYLIGGGAVYLVLWIYGLLIGKDTAANFVPVNTADDWLHFVLGVAMIGLGVALSRGTARTGRTTTATR
jgi:hypothetical protein